MRPEASMGRRPPKGLAVLADQNHIGFIETLEVGERLQIFGGGEDRLLVVVLVKDIAAPGPHKDVIPLLVGQRQLLVAEISRGDERRGHSKVVPCPAVPIRVGHVGLVVEDGNRHERLDIDRPGDTVHVAIDSCAVNR